MGSIVHDYFHADVAKLVLEKSIKIENEIPSFDYEFVDGYKSDREGGDTIDNTWPAEPSSHKNSLPLSTMVCKLHVIISIA